MVDHYVQHFGLSLTPEEGGSLSAQSIDDADVLHPRGFDQPPLAQLAEDHVVHQRAVGLKIKRYLEQ